MAMQAAYPNYRPPDKTLAVDVWHMMLKDYRCADIEAALKAYILTDASGFPPCIGQIVEKAHMLYDNGEMTEMAAWALVRNAISKSGYYSEEEFAKLPPLVQETIRTPAQLRLWAMDESYNDAVVSSNFMRTYRAVVARKREERKLPPDLLKLMREHPADAIPKKGAPHLPDAG